MMRTKIEVDGIIITSRKDIKKIFKAIEQTGMDFNYSAIAKKLNKSVSTIYDALKKFKENNDIELLVKVKGAFVR